MSRLNRALKAQAAMEFLMTYGWAILVVLIVIGVLAYFGVLKPGAMLPEKCTFPTGISCLDFSVTDSYVTLSIYNGAGRSIRINGMTATGDALGAGNLCTTNAGGVPLNLSDDCPTSTGIGVNGCIEGYTFPNGESKMVTMASGSCSFVDTGRVITSYNVTLFYSWTDNPVFMHTMVGELFAKKDLKGRIFSCRWSIP